MYDLVLSGPVYGAGKWVTGLPAAGDCSVSSSHVSELSKGGTEHAPKNGRRCTLGSLKCNTIRHGAKRFVWIITPYMVLFWHVFWTLFFCRNKALFWLRGARYCWRIIRQILQTFFRGLAVDCHPADGWCCAGNRVSSGVPYFECVWHFSEPWSVTESAKALSLRWQNTRKIDEQF